MSPSTRSTMRSFAFVAALAFGSVPMVACGSDDSSSASDVEAAVRATFADESAGDAEAFVAHWTDRGLDQFDVGTREEILSGESEIGGGDGEILKFVETAVKGKAASATLDSRFELTVVRLRFDLIRQGGKWLVDGFEFLGGPPPAPGASVIAVKAFDYGYELSQTKVSGLFAFALQNAGAEPHEITLFRIPEKITVSAAKEALKGVDGGSFEGVPSGYAVAGHVAYIQPGEEQNVIFAKPLEKGRYVLACFILAGGVDDQGQPKTPAAGPHIERGMIAELIVE